MVAGLNNRIREHVNREHIVPARARNASTVTLRSGDIHHEMGLENRMPAVCSAIDARKFEEQYRVQRSRREGPKQSSTVVWQFGVLH